jgi:hypothetical protein
MNSLPILDLIESKRLRDEGMALVDRPKWSDAALAMAISVRDGWSVRAQLFETFAMEDLRQVLVAAGLPEPAHPNAWGAFGMSLAKRGIIVRTGEWRNAKSKKSHACMVPLYRWG